MTILSVRRIGQRFLEYVESKEALLDKDEYNETIINIKRIKREALGFVEDYVAHATGKKVLQEQEFRRRYNYSPLRYFHKELKIAEGVMPLI